MRRSGLDILGDVPWGTHFCQFYQTPADLLDVLVDYFRQGLEDNEFCVWVTSEPLGVGEARLALGRVVPDLEERIRRGQIELIDCRAWYLADGRFDADRVLQGWVEKERTAVARGYEGTRLSGNHAWLDKGDWNAFTGYEAAVNNVVGSYRMLALCTYPLDLCKGLEILDVLRNHPFALIRRAGKWEVIQSPRNRKIEESLRESESILRSFFESPGIMRGIVEVVRDDILHLSDNSVSAAFLGRSQESMRNKFASEMGVPKEFVRRWIRHYEESRRTNQPVRFEYCHASESGENWLLATVSFLEVTPAGHARYVYIVVDITDLKRTQQTLRDSEERLRFHTQNTPLAVIEWGPDFRLSGWSVEAERVFGWRADEVLGKRLDEFRWVFEDDVEQVGRITGDLVDGTRPRSISHNRNYRKNGSVIHCEWYNSALSDESGKLRSILALVLDVTERKRAEEALQQSEQRQGELLSRLNEAQRCASIGSWDWDLVRDTVWWSDELYRIFEVDPDEYTPSVAANAAFVHADDNEAFHHEVQRVIASGSEINCDLRIITRNKTAKHCNFRGVVIRDPTGEPQRFFGTFMDITERKGAEESLQRTAEDLARSNKDLAQFAYVASHDLKEPLRMVTAFTSLLKDRCQGKLDAKSEEYIAFASEAATRMQQLVDDLLAYSRAGRGELTEHADVGAVVDRVLRSLTIGIEESGAVITRDSLPAIVSNSMELAQVFQNLIGNAIKFRGERKPEIHIGAKRQRGDWLFTVRDNGIGIEQQFADRIFMVFEQLHTRDRYPGTGVGLAICKKIVEQHGGRIWVESQPEKGATFCFTIPDRTTRHG